MASGVDRDGSSQKGAGGDRPAAQSTPGPRSPASGRLPPVAPVAVGKPAFGRDAFAALVLALIAIPLNAGVSLASGAPIELGLASAVLGGAVGGLLCDPPFMVIGPAVSLAVGVWGLSRGGGSSDLLGPAVVLVGVIQVLFSLLRLTTWFRIVGPAVVRGVMSGMGLAIIASQLYALVDLRPHDSPLRDLLGLGDTLLVAVSPPEGTTHHVAAVVGLGALAAMALFSTLRPPRWRAVPAPLVGVLVMLGLLVFGRLPIRHIEMQAGFRDVLAFADGARWAALLRSPRVLLNVLGLALVSTSEGLLCASTLEESTGRHARLDRSVLAIGLANIACGLVGGLPVTAVVVRTGVNVEIGARSRRPSLLHALLVFAFAVPFSRALHLVPNAALAAIVTFIGWKLVDLRGAARLETETPGAAYTWFGAGLATFLLGPEIGILLGLALSTLLLLQRALRFTARLDSTGPGWWTLDLQGAAISLRVPRLLALVARVPLDAELKVSLQRVTLLDDACLAFLRKLEVERARDGGRVLIEWTEARRLSTGTYAGVTARASRKKRNDEA